MQPSYQTIQMSDRIRQPKVIDRKVEPFAAKLAVSILGALLCVLCQANGSIAYEDPIVRLDTSKGPIFIRVFRSAAPITCNNFLDLVARRFYPGKIFHRIENWCIQGGDPNGNGSGNFIDPATGGPRFIPLEINRNLRHTSAGIVAMARQANNVNSASCQFYILKCPMPQLDGKYAIFGKVVGGMEAVYSMRRGDVIQNAMILEQQQQPVPVQRQQVPQQPAVPYEPTSDVPTSGF